MIRQKTIYCFNGKNFSVTFTFLVLFVICCCLVLYEPRIHLIMKALSIKNEERKCHLTETKLNVMSVSAKFVSRWEDMPTT